MRRQSRTLPVNTNIFNLNAKKEIRELHPFIKILLVFCIVLNSITTQANEQKEPADIFSRSVKYHVYYYINENSTYTTRYDMATRVIDESAVQNLKSIKITFSTSIEKLEVHEAYNLKASGTKVNVPETNYQQNVNSGRDKKGPVYSDRTALTVVFPDVEVGDTLSYSYTITTIEPMFPGHFTAQDSFPTSYAYDDTKIVLNAPKSLKASYRLRELKENIEHTDDRTIHTWSYVNSLPNKEQREDFSVWNTETYPGFIYSTFSSYQEIVNAYADRALPKAAVTTEVTALAKSIVGSEANAREKARLLYEWVAKNITYAGNCIGIGAVVPHDISFILENRMGDCKDQSTILQALFTAEGINSTQALVNAGPIYSLPEIPTVTAVNHVINYLPDFDIFVDATSESTPFGLITFAIQDKPVLLVEGYKKELRTPRNSKRDSQKITSLIEVDREGNAQGKATVHLSGITAAYSRSAFRYVTPDAEKEWLNDLFSHSGYEGFGSITKDDPTPMIDSFSYEISFSIPKQIPLYGLAAFIIRPVVPSQLAISDLLDVSQKIEEVDIACNSAFSEESYTYRFPDNIEIIATPENALIEGADIYYQSRYEIDGNELRINRKLDDKTEGNICSPEYVIAQKDIIQKILWDVNSQVVYKVKK
jgi:hypothetical protein